METQKFLSLVRVQGHQKLNNSPKASSQHPGCSNLGTKCVELSLGLVPPLPFIFLGTQNKNLQKGFVGAPAQSQACCPQRQKTALTVPTFGQWQSLETETLLKSMTLLTLIILTLSNGCGRDMLLCTMNIFVPIKNIYCFKPGVRSQKCIPKF